MWLAAAGLALAGKQQTPLAGEQQTPQALLSFLLSPRCGPAAQAAWRAFSEEDDPATAAGLATVSAQLALDCWRVPKREGPRR